jgi:hypothetical protein
MRSPTQLCREDREGLCWTTAQKLSLLTIDPSGVISVNKPETEVCFWYWEAAAPRIQIIPPSSSSDTLRNLSRSAEFADRSTCRRDHPTIIPYGVHRDLKGHENTVGRSDHKNKRLCDIMSIFIHARLSVCPTKQTFIQSMNFHETCYEFHINKGYSVSEYFVLPWHWGWLSL